MEQRLYSSYRSFFPPAHMLNKRWVLGTGSLTRQLVVGSVQLSGVRQALVAVFRLHIPSVRWNVELWWAVDIVNAFCEEETRIYKQYEIGNSSWRRVFARILPSIIHCWGVETQKLRRAVEVVPLWSSRHPGAEWKKRASAPRSGTAWRACACTQRRKCAHRGSRSACRTI